MDCTRMRHLALTGGDLAAPEAKQHLDECPACRALFADGPDLASFLAAAEAAPAGPEPPDFAQLERGLAHEQRGLGRLRGLPTWARWLLAAAGLVLPVLIGLVRHRHNLAVYPPARLACELCALAALSLASCWLWIRPLYKPQPSYRALVALVILALAVPWGLALLPPALPPPGPGADALAAAAGCFFFGSLIALPALVLVLAIGRRPSGLPGFALLPATAAALAGIFGLELHCPNTSPVHLAMGHAPIAVALPLVLLIAGLAWRSRARARRTSFIGSGARPKP